MQPLQNIRVLAVTVFLAGPYTSMNLARFGAEVIKVEIPNRGDPVRGNGPFAGPEGIQAEQLSEEYISTRFLKRTQGVKSITLDLKTDKGKEMFIELAKQSDVLLENLAPGSLKKIGLGYEEIKEINPQIIYCSISGYGQTGPYASKPAHDPQIQGMSGLMDINGDPDGDPTRVGFYIGDLVTPIFACYSILGALRNRYLTGQGKYLDVSMMDTLTSLMFMENLEEDMDSGVPLRTGNNSRGGPTGLYQGSDGGVIITVASDDQWNRLAKALDAESLITDERYNEFQKRVDNVESARHEIQSRVSGLTRGEMLSLLEEHDVPCSPVRTAKEVMHDEHFTKRGSLGKLFHAGINSSVPGVGSGFPVLFDGEALPQVPGAPTLGMHNEEILSNLLGLDSEEIQELIDKKIV